jgi:formylglycine-generating enzyme required for sulfatase activity
MKKGTAFSAPALVLAAVLTLAACSPSGDGRGYTRMRLVSAAAIAGDRAYYRDPATTADYEKGVFVEGRTVHLSPFYIAHYETTYGLWYTVYQWAISRGYTFANAGREGDAGTDGAAPTAAKNKPVTCINWRDAVVWCNAYSEMEDKEPVYYSDSAYSAVLRISVNDSRTGAAADRAVMKPEAKGYRLPTEAEWEYAARGGGTPSATGSFAYTWVGTSNESALGNYAWYEENSYSLGSAHADYGAHEVGTKAANGMELYDMSGNVWEWCWDWYGRISTGSQTNPAGPSSGAHRILRGGCWAGFAPDCALAFRANTGSEDSYDGLGFRVAAGAP